MGSRGAILPWPDGDRFMSAKNSDASKNNAGKNHSGKNNAGKTTGNLMWGGRFADRPDDLLDAINVSIDFDKALYRQDIAASKVHVKMLARQNIVSGQDCETIIRCLSQIQGEIEEGRFCFSRNLEDIHMNIEGRLAELAGPVAGRLHTARSRNDQVVTDLRLWVREEVDRIDQALRAAMGVLAARALEHAATIMPGFTHLQTAQPVTLGHHLLAYVEMLARDRGRLADARRRLNECPLGAAALAGTSFDIDRAFSAHALGFDRPSANSLDAVSDRDFVIEVLAAASLCALHLSRLAEEIVLWCSAQFGFATLSDRFSTGSSIMPQKRNPDAAELVRARTGRITGALHAVSLVMKGLPLAYSKDMQEDKEPVFDALPALRLCVNVTGAMVADLHFNKRAMRRAAGSGHATATDLADWLVRVAGLPFREAHHVTGRIVRRADVLGLALHRLPLAEMTQIDERITADVFSVLSVTNSVKSRRSEGGTSPALVRRAARLWLANLV